MSSFSVSRRTDRKRLARKVDVDTPANVQPSSGTELYIMPYSDRSFVVMGDTLSHSNALVSLGGKYNTGLRIGQGWIFSKIREESVRLYIETGEVVPYVYSEKARAQYASAHNQENASAPVPASPEQLRKIFREFRQAFNPDEDYEGKCIIEVIYQLEEKYIPQKKVETKKRLARPAPEAETLDDAGDDEDNEEKT